MFIKLPQEYWIHVAKLDITDLIADHPWIAVPVAVVGGAAIAAGLVFVYRRFVPRVPRPDHGWRIAADPIPAEVDDAAKRDAWIAAHRKVFDWKTLEKVILIGFICVIFAQIVPDIDATNFEILVGTAILITIDSFLGLRTARRSRGVTSIVKAFVLLALANGAVVFVGELIDEDQELEVGNLLFFVLLLTLIVTLYDRYQPFHGVRFSGPAARPPNADRLEGA